MASLCAVAKESGTTFARDALQDYVSSGELPGVITVFSRGDVEETTCLGFADVAAKRSITMDDPFQQCSQTKGFCGVSVAMLVEEGRLRLDDPVKAYLPEFGELWVEQGSSNGVRCLEKARGELTLRMCLTHTGGLRYEIPYNEQMGGWSRRMPLRSVAAIAVSMPLVCEPGTQVNYSNLGFDIAAAVVEVVSGERWEDFLQRRLLGPLDMKQTTFKPSDEQLQRKIEIYAVKQGVKARWIREMKDMQGPYNDDRVFPSAGGGLWTTARDQLKFYKMLMNLGVGENGARVLKTETVKSLLARSQRPQGMGKDGYSLGFSAPIIDDEDQFFGHGGAWGSQCLVNWHRKELRMIVVQLVRGFYFREVVADAARKFFHHSVDDSGVNCYTGRRQ